MNARELLASSLGHRNDEPNKKLADAIIESENMQWITELVAILDEKKGDARSDSIKVLYEVGLRGRSDLIAPHWAKFIEIIGSKDNRLVWGAMIALDCIALEKPAELFKNLETINSAVLKGSTITIDHGVAVLAKLASVEKLWEPVMPLLAEHLLGCPAKQFPMYIERSKVAFSKNTKDDFLGIIEARFAHLDKESQRKRVEKCRTMLQKI